MVRPEALRQECLGPEGMRGWIRPKLGGSGADEALQGWRNQVLVLVSAAGRESLP